MADTGMSTPPNDAWECPDPARNDINSNVAANGGESARPADDARSTVRPALGLLGARASRIRRRTPAPAPRPDPAPTAPELYYATLDDWFQDYFASAYRRSFLGHQSRWCAQWWRHPEAVSRLEAMWRAWEHLRLDPALGMSVWWREHVDTHMAALTHPDGTFKGCQEGDHRTPGRHHLQDRLPHLRRMS